MTMPVELVQISEAFLLHVKKNESTFAQTSLLKDVAYSDMKHFLSDDAEQKAFWINIYNAYYQILRKSGLERPNIFTARKIIIAGIKWSLDDIEHGILRRYRFKYSLGYLPQLFVPRRIRELAVSKVDYRIHFALNCGAKSCPPIAFYSSSKIDEQLEMATISFIEGETDLLHDKKEVHVSRLFLWFMADFGGRRGIRNILKEKLGVDTQGYSIVFKSYSWNELLDNYSALDDY